MLFQHRTFIGVFALGFILVSMISCASLYKDYESQDIKVNNEFEEAVQVKSIEPEPKEIEEESVQTALKVSNKKKPTMKKKSAKTRQPKKKTKAAIPKKKKIKSTAKDKPPVEPKKTKVAKKPRVPELEDAEGFVDRRPVAEPFRVGEQVTLKLSYFAVEAGEFTIGVKPHKQVNGKKSYHFHYKAKSSSLFSLFYAVDDVAETFVDYEQWVPHSYEIHVKESKQVRETRSYFDWKKKRGYMWDKKKAPNKPVEEKRLEWDIFPYSQNVFSVAFYLRTFTLRVGKTLRVRVGHEGKNLIMTAKVLRKEILDTPVGRFKAFVIRPTFEVDGLFKPTGDNLLWVSADERKFILRFESKIRIGTIVAMIESLKK